MMELLPASLSVTDCTRSSSYGIGMSSCSVMLYNDKTSSGLLSFSSITITLTSAIVVRTSECTIVVASTLNM